MKPHRSHHFLLLYFPLFPAACEDSRASPAAIEKRRFAVTGKGRRVRLFRLFRQSRRDKGFVCLRKRSCSVA